MAKYQSYTIFILLFSIAAQFAPAALSQLPGFSTSGLRAVSVFLFVVFAFARVFVVYRLAVATRISVGTAVIAALAGAYIWLGLIALLIVNGRATRALKSGGVRVGLLGPNSEDVARLAAG